MSAQHLPTIDHTVQLTREWVRDLADALDWDDAQRAYRLLRVTLQCLRDWLDVNEASQLGAQLPILVRGIYYDGWHPAKTPARENSKEAFVRRVEKAFETDPIDNVEEAIAVVFALLSERVSAGEIGDVRQRLPRHLRDLWPAG